MAKTNGRPMTLLRWFALATLVTVVAGTGGRAASSGAAQPATRLRPAQVPLSFEVNQGQSDDRVKFLARGHAYTLFLIQSEAVLALTGPALPEPGARQHGGAVVRLRLIGSSPNPTFEGLDPMPARSHYFIGRDRQRWRTGVPHYARVAVHDVYPGIDQVFYAADGELEYDLVVEPQADPERVRIAFDGVDAMRMNEKGDLILTAGDAEIAQRAPLVYQEAGGTRTVVPGRYVLRSAHEVGIEIGAYDPTRPLVIDPVLAYSSYLGGSGYDQGFAVAVDAEGSTYLTGSTSSADFPVVNSMQGLLQRDVFVAKLDQSGSQLVYSTYLGGSTFVESGYVIAVDACGQAYVTGLTDASDFPTANGVQPGYGGGYSDAFVVKLDPAGSALIYSTYVGGSSQDRGQGIVVDSAGSVRLTGETWSDDFPTVNALQPVRSGPPLTPDVFVTRLDAAGAAFVYSTYLGGSFYESGNGIALDAAGNAYVTGYTQSDDFPVANAIQPTMAGPDDGYVGGRTDAFITSVDPAGALLYSTYFGGAGADYGKGIAVDAAGHAFITGLTASTDFPTVNAAQPVNGTSGLYRSTDGGATWSALGFNNYSVTSVAVDRGDPSTVFVATSDGIFKTTDDGQQWSDASAGLTTRSVNEIAIDPLNSSTLYAATIGYRSSKARTAEPVGRPSPPRLIRSCIPSRSIDRPRWRCTPVCAARGQEPSTEAPRGRRRA